MFAFNRFCVLSGKSGTGPILASVKYQPLEWRANALICGWHDHRAKLTAGQRNAGEALRFPGTPPRQVLVG